MLNSGWITSIWALFYLSYFHPGNSDDYFEEDSLGSRTDLVMHVRDSVPNRSYDGSFFVLCDFHGDSNMVPWTHWREPRSGRLLTEWTSEFTVFNLVIRVSNGKQSALFRVSPVEVDC